MSKRAAIYCRVSTDEQAQEGATSLDEQERECRAHADKEGWQIAGVYRDDYTGMTDDRPEWNRLMLAAQRREFSIVVCKTRDRFARDDLVAGLMQKDLARSKVTLWYKDTGKVDLNDDSSRFADGVLNLAAAHNRRVLLRTMAGGAHGKARAGRWPSSPQGAPFGMQVVGTKRDAHLELEPDEVAVVDRAVALLLDEGRSVPDAARVLNSMGLLGRGYWQPVEGGPAVHVPAQWSPLSLRRMLSRPTLYGEVEWGSGRFATRDDSGGLKYGGGVRVADAPVVIDRATWDRVQKALVVHGPRTDYEMSYPLSLRIESACGRKYTGIYRNDRHLRSYRCQGKVRRGETCTCPWYDADALDDRVWAAVTGLLADPDRLTRMAREYLAAEQGRAVSQADELESLKELIATREQQIAAGLAAAIRAGVDAAAMEIATRDLQLELGVLRARRDAIEQYRADAAAQGQAISQAAGLAQRAAGRLAEMDARDRAGVIRALDLRVRPLDSSRRPRLEIGGSIAGIALLDGKLPDGDASIPACGFPAAEWRMEAA